MTDPWTPSSLTEFVGQRRVMDQLEVSIAAAMEKRNAGQAWCFSVAAVGPPGVGKSVLGSLVAQQHLLGIDWWRVQGSQLRTPEVAQDWLRRFAHDFARTGRTWMWILDESHLAPPGILEECYPVLQYGHFADDGGTKPLPLLFWFTSNYASGLPEPLLSRCMVLEFQYYSEDEIEEILTLSAERLGYSMTGDACVLLASYAWGEPRRANHLLQAVADGMLAFGKGTRIQTEHVRAAFARLRLQQGLTETQIGLLRALAGARNRRMGVRTLAGVLSRSERDIASRIEPVLLRRGAIAIVPGGRELTLEGARVLLGTLEAR